MLKLISIIFGTAYFVSSVIYATQIPSAMLVLGVVGGVLLIAVGVEEMI